MFHCLLKRFLVIAGLLLVAHTSWAGGCNSCKWEFHIHRNDGTVEVNQQLHQCLEPGEYIIIWNTMSGNCATECARFELGSRVDVPGIHQMVMYNIQQGGTYSQSLTVVQKTSPQLAIIVVDKLSGVELTAGQELIVDPAQPLEIETFYVVESGQRIQFFDNNGWERDGANVDFIRTNNDWFNEYRGYGDEWFPMQITTPGAYTFNNPALAPFSLLVKSPEVDEAPLGNTELEGEESVSFYPNPVRDHLTFQATVDLQTVQYTIYQLDGSIALQGRGQEGSQGTIPLSELPQGFYILEFNYDEKQVLHRFIKGI